MDHPNTALAYGFWSAVADGDADRLRKLLGQDVVWHSVGQNQLTGLFRGREAVIEYLARVGDSADELRSDLKSVFAGDDGAVLWNQVRARRGIRSMELDFLVMLQVKDGQMIKIVSTPLDPYANDSFWG